MAEKIRGALQQPSPRHTRRLGNIAIQIIMLAVIGSLAYAAVFEAVQNLARAHIASGFGFWKNTAGFDISQALIAYSPSASTFGRAFWVGLLNTLIVAAIGIVLATVLGFAVGIARLSGNWLVARLAAGYVELIAQCAALVAASVLVQRGAQIAAGIARQRDAPGRRHSQQSRSVSAAAGIWPAILDRADRARDRHRGDDCARELGAPPSRPHRRRAARSLARARPHRRAAACRLRAHRFPADLQRSAYGPLQCQRRRRNPPRIRRAASGAVGLYCSLHRRGGARRHARRVRAARPKPRRRSGFAPA